MMNLTKKLKTLSKMPKSKFKLESKCGWFYVIQLQHNGKWGFGITLNSDSRLRKGYCNPSAEKQVFCHLYYGNYSQITALERHLKNEWKDKMLVLFDDKLEWIDPKNKINGDDITAFVEERCKAIYPEIYRIKKEYLPFSPSKVFKDIKDDPDKFLEQL